MKLQNVKSGAMTKPTFPRNKIKVLSTKLKNGGSQKYWVWGEMHADSCETKAVLNKIEVSENENEICENENEIMKD